MINVVDWDSFPYSEHGLLKLELRQNTRDPLFEERIKVDNHTIALLNVTRSSSINLFCMFAIDNSSGLLVGHQGWICSTEDYQRKYYFHESIKRLAATCNRKLPVVYPNWIETYLRIKNKKFYKEVQN